MSEDISDKIENDEWINDEYIEVECADGIKRKIKCDAENGYDQKCGGWEHTETGQIYGVASWGTNQWNDNKYQDTITLSQLINDESLSLSEVNKIKGRLTHPFGDQMKWWFEQKDIDTTKLVAITFRWSNPHMGSYYVQNGPQLNKRVEEGIPACIPRGFYAGINGKKTHGKDDAKNVSTYEVNIPCIDVEKIVTGGN